MFKAIWLAGIMLPTGSVFFDVPEAPTRTFQTKQSCERFGAEMNGRMQDFMRGVLFLDWDHPVSVTIRCLPNGEPA